MHVWWNGLNGEVMFSQYGGVFTIVVGQGFSGLGMSQGGQRHLKGAGGQQVRWRHSLPFSFWLLQEGEQSADVFIRAGCLLEHGGVRFPALFLAGQLLTTRESP